MQSQYEFPIIPNNLRHEETIVQIADVCKYLCDVFDDIITTVNKRIDKNVTHLSKLSQRIEQTIKKISKLTGTKKATQVFSCSKYPATDIHKNYKTLFSSDDVKNVPFRRTKVKYKNLILSEQPLEKLQFYHVKFNDKGKTKKYATIEQGLGSFPNDIESINELLLFNTSKNPYKNYVMSDPLQVAQHIRETDQLSVPGPDAAPLSISQRAALCRSVGENYFYSPGLGDVPAIDVPLDLPDLPGVADDLRYLMESGPAIAPSVTTTPIVPDLPSIIQSPNDMPSNNVNAIAITESVPLLASPVPTLIIVQESNTVIENKSEIVPSPSVVPKLIEEQSVAKNIEEKTTKQNALPVIEDARATLMAAIRQAGGMKNANLRNTEAKQENKIAMSGSNLMADLNAKLALRRKGISGSKISDGSEMNSALSRISAMIPPPPPATDLNESTNTEDEDWDE